MHGPYPPIQLRREGVHLIVSIEVGGSWYDVIETRDGGPAETSLSEIVEPAGIQRIVEGDDDA